MRNRHRRMYELTGLPGWMRFGYSPGWQGRSPSGLGPCAQYFMHGNWPAPGFPMPGFTTPYDPWGAAELTPQQELDFLKAEAQQLQDELSGVKQRIQELERDKK